MRFLETLLVLFVAIYLAQLLIAILVLATFMLFLWTLWKRPREALMFGLAVLAVVFVSKPIGLAVALTIAAGLFCLACFHVVQARRRERKRRPIALIGKS